MSRGIRAVLLDRDGVINREGGHVCSLRDFSILDGVPEAIARLNRLNIKVIVVTNQSGLARGLITEKQLDEIHARLEEQLSENEAHVDGIYISPWHPDLNLPNGVRQWLGEHDDRKPGAGMLKKAMKHFEIEAGEAVMVGDSAKDRDAAKNAGVKFYGVVSSKVSELDSESKLYQGLFEVVEELLNEEG